MFILSFLCISVAAVKLSNSAFPGILPGVFPAHRRASPIISLKHNPSITVILPTVIFIKNNSDGRVKSASMKFSSYELMSYCAKNQSIID